MTEVASAAKNVKKPTPFDHPSMSVFVLVPWDENDRRATLEGIEALVDGLEKAPAIVTQLKVGRRRDNDVVYTAIMETKRVRNEKTRKFETSTQLKISEPIFCSKFISPSLAEDGDNDINVSAFVDAIQAGAMPCVCRLSGDKSVSDKNLKLFSL